MTYEEWKQDLNEMVVKKGLMVGADEPFTDVVSDVNWRDFFDRGLTPFEAYCEEGRLTDVDIERIHGL